MAYLMNLTNEYGEESPAWTA